MKQINTKGYTGLGVLALIIIGLGPVINKSYEVSAQITIGDDGSVAIKTDQVYQNERALNIECSSATDCGSGQWGYGLYALGANALNAHGVYGIGRGYGGYGVRGHAEQSYAGTGIRGSASGSTLYNRGIHGSASGSNAYGGYFTQGIFVSGGITHSSDERLKTNIHSLRNEGMLARIRQLNPARYEFLNSDQLRQRGLPASHAEEGEHLGLLAQEVEQVFPELVREVVHLLDDEFSAEIQGESRTTTAKGINYNGLIVALIAAVQEQQFEIEQLRAELEAMK